MAMAVAEQAKELGFAITPEGASNDDITKRVYCLILESSPAFWIGMVLTKHDLTVIKKLNVTVHEGEILAIAGASRSGKSVLAHAVLGILPSNASVGGEIRCCGKRLTDSLRKEKAGSEIIMIPQSVTYLDSSD